MGLSSLVGLGGPWGVLAAIADVLLVSYVIYRVLLLIKGTTAVPMLVGLGMITIAFFASKWLGLQTFHWLVSQFLSYSFIFGIIVLFQNDIRRGLARLGQGWSLGYDRAGEASRIEEVVQAAVKLARLRHGALIVMERTAELDDLVASGVRLNADVSDELLLSIFHKGTPLHDGAVVISRGRITAAKCMLPLTANPAVGRDLGTRHRSAIGLTEEVDAAVLVVSEERGKLSLAVGGKLHRDMDADVLRKFLLRLYAAPRRGTLPPRQRKAAA
jgi:diadenylate cyclase